MTISPVRIAIFHTPRFSSFIKPTFLRLLEDANCIACTPAQAPRLHQFAAAELQTQESNLFY
jgi:hypothetical protein